MPESPNPSSENVSEAEHPKPDEASSLERPTPGGVSAFPLAQALSTYNVRFLRKDVIAGITVAFLDVPQGIAYAIIAGLPPVYGLYASVVNSLVTSALSHSRFVVSGPTNAVALMVAGVVTRFSPEMRANPAGAIALLTLMVGAVQLALGFLKLGNLSQFISRTVLVGFTSGAGLLIAMGQIGPMLGIHAHGEMAIAKAWKTFSGISAVHWPSAVLGVGTVTIILVGRRYLPRFPWPLIAVVASSISVAIFDLEAKGVALVGDVPSTLPPFTVPTLDVRLLADLAQGALAIAILGCIASLSIAKSIAVTTGDRVDANRDFIGLGAGHFIGGLFHCMPGCGSFTRSALIVQAGAQTRLAGIFCSLTVLLVIVALAPAARFIPMPALAGMLVVLGVGFLKWKHIKVSLRSTKSDATVLFATFVCTLVLHLETAIYVGVLCSLGLFLRKASAPHLVEYDVMGETMREIRDPKDRTNPEVSIIHVEGELFFGAAELFEEEVRRLARDPNIRVVILRMKNARHLDATAVMALDGLAKFMKETGRKLLISGASAEVMRVLVNSGIAAQLGENSIFQAEENLTAATRKALLAAREFLGTGAKPDVRIFYEKSRAEKGPATAG